MTVSTTPSGWNIASKSRIVGSIQSRLQLSLADRHRAAASSTRINARQSALDPFAESYPDTNWLLRTAVGIESAYYGAL
jgi:hypothetical protein